MSRLTDIISLLYRMDDGQIESLENALLEGAKDAWASALANQARIHKCAGVPNPPRMNDLAELRRQVSVDAASITATYERDLAREIERLRVTVPTGNRNYYYKNLELWAAKRGLWKGVGIAMNTETQARSYATRRFRDMNYVGGERFRFAGPPPVCKKCVKLLAVGVVDRAFIEKNSVPVHYLCPHHWRVVKPPKLDCANIWLG